MDELELLKKDWKKQEGNFKELSYNEIYKIIQKKSSSVVKWIFIICLAEFLFWGVVSLFIPDSIYDIYKKLDLNFILNISYVLNYIIVFVFLYLFYKNYKAISVTDSTKMLMKNIIKTRKTVKYYVYINVFLAAIFSIILNYSMVIKGFKTMNISETAQANLNITSLDYTTLVISLISFILTILLIWGYYKLIYGFLLRKLNKNYKELKSLEF